MMIIYENRFTELGDNENEPAEVKRFEVRVSVGGLGVEKCAVMEMLADISDKVLEMAIKDTEVEDEESTDDMGFDSIHDKFEAGTERKGWFK